MKFGTYYILWSVFKYVKTRKYTKNYILLYKGYICTKKKMYVCINKKEKK